MNKNSMWQGHTIRVLLYIFKHITSAGADDSKSWSLSLNGRLLCKDELNDNGMSSSNCHVLREGGVWCMAKQAWGWVWGGQQWWWGQETWLGNYNDEAIHLAPNAMSSLAQKMSTFILTETVFYQHKLATRKLKPTQRLAGIIPENRFLQSQCP